MKLPKFYAITDQGEYGEDFFGTLERVLRSGVKMVQLREKNLKDLDYYLKAKEVRKITKRFEALLFINERFDLALSVDADGVHLPQNSLPPSVVRERTKLLVGFSAHDLKSALYAQREGAHFITLSPIYRTKSHPKAKPLGLEELGRVCRALKIPVYALGGVSRERVKEVLRVGAYGVAGIRLFLNQLPDG